MAGLFLTMIYMNFDNKQHRTLFCVKIISEVKMNEKINVQAYITGTIQI